MKNHEIEVKNKDGKTFTVSVNHYLANEGTLEPVMGAKEAKVYCSDYIKSVAANKKKMEAEALKNKSA